MLDIDFTSLASFTNLVPLTRSTTELHKLIQHLRFYDRMPISGSLSFQTASEWEVRGTLLVYKEPDSLAMSRVDRMIFSSDPMGSFHVSDKFIVEHGRRPTGEELSAAVDEIKNANIERTIRPFSNLSPLDVADSKVMGRDWVIVRFEVAAGERAWFLAQPVRDGMAVISLSVGAVIEPASAAFRLLVATHLLLN